jgi:hypothetical protein
MKLAIMQPYLFPYIGYFQLIDYVDHFIIYDDVHYMKRKWINRNRIIVNNTIHTIRAPIIKASQNKLINETLLLEDNAWKNRLLKTITFAYKKAPEFDRVYPCIEEIILNKEQNLAKFIKFSLSRICEFIEISTRLSCSSQLDNSYCDERGESRIIKLCQAEDDTVYVNPMNGRDLYDKSRFKDCGIDLKFIISGQQQSYQQFSDSFSANLSIIDVLMFNNKIDIETMLLATKVD